MAKSAHLLILLTFLPTFIFGTDWKLGVSLKGATSGLKASDLCNENDLGIWPENKVTLYSLSDGSKLIVSMNHYPIGVITKIDGKNCFLLDYNGDSILDCSPELLFVPPWVVDVTSKGSDKGEVIVKQYEKKFESFAGNTLPAETELVRDVSKKVIETAEDKNAPDRIYVYFDFLYDLEYNRKEYEIAEACLLNIEKITSTSENARSAWLIEAVEVSYKRGDLENCSAYLSELLKKKPQFVPALYYQYLIETDPSIKDREKAVLINQYKDHWMVQDRFH